ncbi:MAG: protein translocase subunit SecD [Anaerolineales bacterium]|nr:protein translocase subunit SecD [Anaerolineales bacterium]MCB8951978.1 protein translocase subunit SecD [Ardenticatenales bacterium]
MYRRDLIWFVLIIGLVAAAIWMAMNENFPIRQGLDLSGGLQVLLEADVPADQAVTREQMDTARSIISQRINGLGVSEPVVQLEGDRRILVELPGVDNPDQAFSLIQGTALLEFVDTGTQGLPEGLCIRTTHDAGISRCELENGRTEAEAEQSPAPTFSTVLTGDKLKSATAGQSSFGEYYVAFEMTPEGADLMQQHTSANVGKFLTIVLDKRVISSPTINAVLSDSGQITGRFTLEEAQQLALQLSYGSLPVPLRIEATRQIGATLGTQSVQASIRAGAIGVLIVLLFMLIYYRVPGLLADVALVIYALLNFAFFKWIGVTLTLPAITGFLLSTGMAVDANILVFERMKEELRGGGSLNEAIHDGFTRAWTSIRDSNIATLIICFILFIFGRNFGASTVQGFAITLAIGVLISMFTAVTVTRTFVRLIIGNAAEWLTKHKAFLLS